MEKNKKKKQKKKNIRNRTRPIACAKHMIIVQQFPHEYLSFHGMCSSCAWKTYVENTTWKQGLKPTRPNFIAAIFFPKDHRP